MEDVGAGNQESEDREDVHRELEDEHSLLRLLLVDEVVLESLVNEDSDACKGFDVDELHHLVKHFFVVAVFVPEPVITQATKHKV